MPWTTIIICQVAFLISTAARKPLMARNFLECPSDKSNNFDPDILLEYQASADTISTQLWRLITEWIKRCHAGHRSCNSHSTTSLEFPSRLVELRASRIGLEARLVDTRARGFVRRYEIPCNYRFASALAFSIEHRAARMFLLNCIK